jgi:hypothetical protein
MWQSAGMAKNERPARKPASADSDHVGVRLRRDLRRRLNAYASLKERDKQEVLDEAVEGFLKDKKVPD